MHEKSIRIANRFQGPSGSGNGGYVAGLLARELGGSNCVVTLRRRTPLDHDMRITIEGGEAALMDGNDLVASAARAPLVLDVPPPPTMAEAEAASARFSGYHKHPVPDCFVCGTNPPEGDGLRIFTGPVEGRKMVAAPWIAHPSLGDGAGRVDIEYLWAGLDCAGFFAIEDRVDLAILGRMTARIDERPRVGDTLVVSGWRIESDGRNHQVGTAIHGEDGRLVAAAQATWIALQV